MSPTDRKPYKTCPMCLHSWPSIRNFIEDQSLKLNGYFADFDDPGEGIIVLTHMNEDCGTSIGVKAQTLAHLYNGPRFPELMAGQPSCPRKCDSQHDFAPCDQRCSMHWVREVMQIIRSHRYPETVSNVESIAPLPIHKR